MKSIIICKKERVLGSKSYCKPCAVTVLYKKKVICKECGKLKTFRAFGLCETCYQRDVLRKTPEFKKRRKIKDYIEYHNNSKRYNYRINQAMLSRQTKKLLSISKCFYCDSKENLNKHHINKDNSNNYISNIMILCTKCHQRVHQLLNAGRVS